ncbi:uncharacterized protein LOC142073349 [Caretta caretta]|uniref:uncharacterized protein LOC142073349 n=1 Tax=Caretta caretta TaxID=8467 RepID=UPI003F4BA811
MAEAAPIAAASSSTTASLPAVPSTSSASVPPPAPRAYARAVAAPPPPAASSSHPPPASATINSGQGPFPTTTRKHGVRCLLVPASPHVETYVQALATVLGPTAIVAASKMYGKVVFFLASEAVAQEVVEKGLAVGGVFVPLEPLEDLGVRLVLTSIPPFLPNAALLPALSTLGKPISVISPLPLGCKDPAPRHILSFCRQVQLLPPPAARDGEVLEGSFLVPYQRARYWVYYSTGEARCYLCRSVGHVQRDCPLARRGGAPETPEKQQDIGSVVADTPGRPRSETTSPPARFTAAPARAQETPPLQCPDEQGSPALAVNNPAEPTEEGAAKILPGIGEGPPPGEPPPLPHVASPLPPQAPEPPPLPPDMTPANQPPDDAMEGWTLVQGKRGKRKARAPLHPSDAEVPRNTRKGGTDTEPSAMPMRDIHPPVSGVEDKIALEDPPQGAVFAFSCRDPLGAAIFPPPSSSTPSLETDLITLACQTPRRWSAPCLPASADHKPAPKAPPGNNPEIATPPPHELRKALRQFLEDISGSRNRVQLALQLWGDFDHIIQATRALLKEGKGKGRHGAAAYGEAEGAGTV